MMKFRSSLWGIALVFVVLAGSAFAQDDASFERRLELATKMQALQPVQAQVDNAIDQYVAGLPAAQQAAYRTALQNILNYKVLEKVSIEAYADVFTEAELQAMIEYYQKPEAQTAAEKTGEYAAKIYPEIINMLDKAMMRVKSGENP